PAIRSRTASPAGSCRLGSAPRDLPASISRLRSGRQPRTSNTEIAPNASLMMFVTFSFDSLDQAPKVVLHRVSLLGANSPAPGNPVPVTELVTPYNIAAGTPMVLAPPVRGRNWVALNGCCEPYFVHVTAAN